MLPRAEKLSARNALRGTLSATSSLKSGLHTRDGFSVFLLLLLVFFLLVLLLLVVELAVVLVLVVLLIPIDSY
jgi:uncharacterized protein YqhQ